VRTVVAVYDGCGCTELLLLLLPALLLLLAVVVTLR
jgi:hypothetical protein